MNSTDLLKEIDKRLYSSGIVDMTQQFIQEHPEYWASTVNFDGLICTCSISITGCVPGHTVADVKPFINMDIGSHTTTMQSLSDFRANMGSSKLGSKRYIDGNIVSEYRYTEELPDVYK